MPIVQDPNSPSGTTIPLVPADISRLRKGANDQFVADKAYNLDPQFRALADHYLSPEVNGQLDAYTKQRLPTMLLNLHYYGKAETGKMDDLTASLSQPSAPQVSWSTKLAGAIQDYAAAPSDVASGLINKGLSAASGAIGFDAGKQAGQRVAERYLTPDRIEKAGDTLSTVGTVAASLATGGLSIPASAGIVGAAGAAGSLIDTAAEDLAGKDVSAGDYVTRAATQGVANAAIDAATLGAGKLIGKGFEAALKWTGEKMPPRIINSLIKPASKEFKFGKNPGEAIVREGIVAFSVDDLLSKVTTKADEVGKQISASIQKAGAGKAAPQIDLLPIISQPIDDEIRALSKLPKSNAADIAKLQDLKDDLVASYGKTFEPLGVFNAKSEVQNLIQWNKADPFAETKNATLWKVFDGMRNALNKNVDGLSALNERYSELIAAKTSIARRAEIAARSNLVGLTPAIGAGAAGAGTFAATGDPKQALLAAGAGTLAPKLLGSTMAKTIEAQIAKKLGTAGLGILSTIQKLAPAEKALILSVLQPSSNSQ